MTKSFPVAVIADSTLAYPDFPYLPDKRYPENPLTDIDSENRLYPAARRLFTSLRLDKAHFGRSTWNPLGVYIRPGETVVIKPNWVMHTHPLENNLDALITHTALIRFIIDYTLIALRDRGTIVIADAPLQACNFNQLLHRSRVKELITKFQADNPTVKFAVYDLRRTVMAGSRQKKAGGDPAGYSLINLGQGSLLTDLADHWRRLRVTMYDPSLMLKHHNQHKHEYLVSNTVLNADVVINMAKMKTHVKAGITGAMKNLVGINGHKEYLPHHIQGSHQEGGDQYIFPSRYKKIINKLYDAYWFRARYLPGWLSTLGLNFQKILVRTSALITPDNLFEGGWWGNETVPRMTIDLNHILYFYSRSRKSLLSRSPRRVFNLVDGIIAGEGTGPLKPQARTAGILIAGEYPLAVDLVMAKLMGYSVLKIKTLLYALTHPKSRLNPGLKTTDMPLVLNGRLTDFNKLPNLKFIKPPYWSPAETTD